MSMTNMDTLADYMKGRIRDVEVPDSAIKSISIDVGVDPMTPIAELTEKQRELSIAWLYVWAALSPTRVGERTEADADWRSTDGGYEMSANVLNNYLKLANAIFEKYDLPIVGEGSWGFSGHGMRHPRYNGRTNSRYRR